MSSSGADHAAGRLPELRPPLAAFPGHGRVLVAFSGGGDSVCLLHQCLALRNGRGLFAVHVDHGLDRGSADRARRAMELAAGMGVDCLLERVTVRRSGSIEANARAARYAALARHLIDEGVMLTAHHADDVAETMMLRLLRGAGPGGLAGIPSVRRHAQGWLVRPLLDWSRGQVLSYLNSHQLDWIRDPANELAAMDRNFIRHEIMPLLAGRFPGAVRALNRSAGLNRAALATLNAVAESDLDSARRGADRLDLASLNRLDAYRSAEAIRRWCIEMNEPPPPGARLQEFLAQVRAAGPDRRPELRWGQAVLRRYADALWLETPAAPAELPWCRRWDGASILQLPRPSGQLEFIGGGPPLDLRVRSGGAGEKIRLRPQRGRRRVKDLMNENRIPPWQRACWPRLYRGDTLIAVGNRWLDQEFAAMLRDEGRTLAWRSVLFGSCPAGCGTHPLESSHGQIFQ